MVNRKKKRRINSIKIKRLAQIDRNHLRDLYIQGVILDLDNTVISEDDTYLSPEAELWISSALAEGMKIFILSNGKRKYRVNYWSKRLQVPAISPARKPFPFNFWKALKNMQLKPEQVVVIGDSFHTDILGAIFIGCFSIQVSSLPHPPRWWEKIVGKWLQEAYRDIHELWLFESKYL